MLPLEGIRIVDITVVLAGPYGAMMLADMGAEVIRVESTQVWQNSTRGQNPHPTKEQSAKGTLIAGQYYPNKDPGERHWNRYLPFNCHSRNKLSMTVDLRAPRGKEIFKRLVRVSDVVIENNAAGVIEGLGLGYKVLREVKPDIIMLSSTGMGSTGPYRHFRGFGSQFEAVVGHSWLLGYPDSEPSTSSILSDASAGAALALAVVMALHYRNRTGEGQFIDLSQGEVLMPYFGQAIMDYTMNGRVQGRVGNRSPFLAPQGVYRCQGEDRWLALSIASDEEFQALCQAMGMPDLAKDPRFADAVSRYRHQDELNPIIEAWTLRYDHHELFRLLQGLGIAAGPVLDAAECLADPQLNDRGFFEEVTHPEAGTHRYPGMLWKLSETPGRIHRHAPLLGQDNEYVYKTLLGTSDEEYMELEKEGHIGTEYPPEVASYL